MQNHLSKPEDLKHQIATLLRKSAPGPPNISDEHVSCTAPATRHASVQILFECPTPGIVFETATKPSRFAHFWEGAESLAPAAQSDTPTSKNGPNMLHHVALFHILTWTRASRQNGVHFFIISTSKVAPNLVVFVHFDCETRFASEQRAFFSPDVRCF